MLIENYRYPPAALARERESSWELLRCDGQACEEVSDEDILDEDGELRERFEFQEVLPDGTVLSGTALLLVNLSSRKTFSMEMRSELLPEANAHSLTMMLRVVGPVAGQVTNLNVSRAEPRIEVHSGRVFPEFGPVDVDFLLIPTALPSEAEAAEGEQRELQRVTRGLSFLLQQRREHVLACVGGGDTYALLSPGGVCEARFRDDGRSLDLQAAAALGVLPSRVSCKREAVIVQGEPLEDIGQLTVVRPTSPEVLYTGALEGDVVETLMRGKLSFFVVAPDASFEPRRHRILESLRKPSETHEVQSTVFLNVQAATEERYRKLLCDAAKMTPLSDVDDARRHAPRRALDGIHAVIGSDAYSEARGSQALARAQLAALGKADSLLAEKIASITAGKPECIWHEDVVLDAVAQGIWHSRHGSMLARSVYGLPPTLEDDSDNDVPDVLDGSGGDDDEEERRGDQSSAASGDAPSDTDDEELLLLPQREPEADSALCTGAEEEEALAPLLVCDNGLPEEHAAFLQQLSEILERSGNELSATEAATMQDATRRRAWLELAEEIDEEEGELSAKARRQFWTACATRGMARHITRACLWVEEAISAPVTLRQQLNLLNMWVADNAVRE